MVALLDFGGRYLNDITSKETSVGPVKEFFFHLASLVHTVEEKVWER
jgi:hypothetical protein